jgi:hypothetical protein
MKLTCIVGDQVQIFLGCYSPTTLRSVDSQNPPDAGEAYIHGLEDNLGTRGLLPAHWKATVRRDTLAQPLQRYVNLTILSQTVEDPRLDVLPPGCGGMVSERSRDDSALFEVFRNSFNGETINSDPQLPPEYAG